MTDAFDRICAARVRVMMHDDYLDLLPATAGLPSLYSRLHDGRISATTVPLGAAPAADDDVTPASSRTILFDLTTLDDTAHTHAQRAASAAVSSYRFLALYDSASPAGRARLLDGSASTGSHSWLRRVPSEPPSAADHYGVAPSAFAAPETSRFAFHHPSDYSTALALDCLLRPPLPDVEGGGAAGEVHCLKCAAKGRPSQVGVAGRHLFTGGGAAVGPDGGGCYHGIQLHTTLHDPVVAALTGLLDAASSTAVLAERRGDHGAVLQFMMTQGRRLGWSPPTAAAMARAAADDRDPLPTTKRPDIILFDWDGTGRHLIIDVKTLAVGCSTSLSHHTDFTRLAAHQLKERNTPAEYVDSATGRIPPRFRLVTFAVSENGTIGAEGRNFLGEVGRRIGRALPVALLDDSTWAAPHFGPFARMTISLAVRRAAAHAVRRYWGTSEEAGMARQQGAEEARAG